MQGQVTLKTAEQLALMRQAGKIVALALATVERAVEPGITTAALDRVAERAIRAADGIPSFKGYHGYPATLCTSLNEEIVHGIPSESRALCAGDVIKIDCGAIYRGWHGDAAVTLGVGRVGSVARRVMAATRQALEHGIAAMRVGGHVSDIGQAIETYARARGYQVVREYCGHGIGSSLHEEPAVPNYGPAGQGPRLDLGLVLAIEPMLNLGTWRTAPQPDGWTVKTADGKLSAHFEHTVALTEDGPQILTLP